MAKLLFLYFLNFILGGARKPPIRGAVLHKDNYFFYLDKRKDR